MLFGQNRKMRKNLLLNRFKGVSSLRKRARKPAPWSALVAETLEQRVAPSNLVSLVNGPNLLTAGEIGEEGAAPVIVVDSGKVMVWITHVEVAYGSLTGLSMSDGSSVTLLSDVNGDIVTNLNTDGTLSGPLHDGLCVCGQLGALETGGSDRGPARFGTSRTDRPGSHAASPGR